jgi:hypothetical protein
VRAVRAIVRQVDRAVPAELSEGLTRLIPALRSVAVGNGVGLVRLTAGLVESGADPLPILDVLVERVSDALEQAARYPALAETAGVGLAKPTDAAGVSAVLERVTRAGARVGLGAYEAGLIVQAWLTANDWIPGLLVPLQQKRARAAVSQQARLTAAAEAMSEHAEDASWLLGLLAVLDDEQLIVVHRASRRVYAVTISGIGDNFQLHTLLAATLIGDPAQGLIPGQRPHAIWIAAATDGEMAPTGGVQGQFNLVDATGEWIWNEGRPADIPLVAGHRVIVIDPAPYQRSWNIGRAYPLMVPQIHLNHILPADEAAAWTQRIAPAKPPIG